MFNKEEKPKAGDEIVVERNLQAEVPYELVKILDANGNGRMFTRNIRNDEEAAVKAENVVKQKEKELEAVKEVAEKAKKKVSKKKEE